MDDMKICNKCEKNSPKTDFYKTKIINTDI